MNDLDAEASRLLIAIGLEWAGTEPRMVLIRALKAEGARRAADMRERAASVCVAEQKKRVARITSLEFEVHIRSLPLESEFA